MKSILAIAILVVCSAISAHASDGIYVAYEPTLSGQEFHHSVNALAVEGDGDLGAFAWCQADENHVRGIVGPVMLRRNAQMGAGVGLENSTNPLLVAAFMRVDGGNFTGYGVLRVGGTDLINVRYRLGYYLNRDLTLGFALEAYKGMGPSLEFRSGAWDIAVSSLYQPGFQSGQSTQSVSLRYKAF